MGKTQKEFALLVGSEENTIKSLELGRRTLQPDLARRISAVSGVSDEELLKGKTGKAVTPNGEPFTRDLYHKRISMFRLTEDATVPNCIAEHDIIDFPSLIRKLQAPSQSNPLTRYLEKLLHSNTKRALANYEGNLGKDKSETALKQMVIADLNRLMKAESFYDRVRFKGVMLSDLTDKFLRNPQHFGVDRLNRLLLEDAYPHEISKHRTAEDQANHHAQYINEFVKMVLIAASQGNQPVLTAVAWAMIQEIDKIRHAFHLQDKMWTEWEKRCVKKIPYTKPGTKLGEGSDVSASSGLKDSGSYYEKIDPSLPGLLYLIDPVAQKWMGLDFDTDIDAKFGKPTLPPRKSRAKKGDIKRNP